MLKSNTLWHDLNLKTSEKQSHWHRSFWKGLQSHFWGFGRTTEPLSTNGENTEQRRTFPRGVRCSKITPITHQRLIKKVTKEPRTIFKELHVSVTSVKVKVHNSIITKRLRKDGIHWWFLRTKPMLTKKNTKTCLTFVLQSWGLSTFWWPQHFEDFWERLSAAKRMAQHRRANL